MSSYSFVWPAIGDVQPDAAGRSVAVGLFEHFEVLFAFGCREAVQHQLPGLLPLGVFDLNAQERGHTRHGEPSGGVGTEGLIDQRQDDGGQFCVGGSHTVRHPGHHPFAGGVQAVVGLEFVAAGAAHLNRAVEGATGEVALLPLRAEPFPFAQFAQRVEVGELFEHHGFQCLAGLRVARMDAADDTVVFSVIFRDIAHGDLASEAVGHRFGGFHFRVSFRWGCRLVADGFGAAVQPGLSAEEGAAGGGGGGLPFAAGVGRIMWGLSG